MNDTKQFTTRELTKRGFVKTGRFEDDGNWFTEFDYKGLRVTYLKSEGEYYLDGSVPSSDNYIYDDYGNTEWYRSLSRYNGVSRIDIEDFVNICETALVEIKKLNERPHQEIDKQPILDRIKYEIKLAEDTLKAFRDSNVIYTLNQYEVKYSLDYYKSLERYLENLKKYDVNSLSYSDLRRESNNVAAGRGVFVDNDSFYVRKLNEYVNGVKD